MTRDISPPRLSDFQKFFVNEAFWRNPDGPVFLYIGGEGPIFEYDVLAGTTGRSLRQAQSRKKKTNKKGRVLLSMQSGFTEHLI